MFFLLLCSVFSLAMADNPTCTSYDDLEDALEMLSEFKNVNRDSEIQLEVPNLLSSDDESDDGYEGEIGKESHDEYNSIAALRKQKLPVCVTSDED